MSNFEQFLGGRATPVGGQITAIDAPSNFTDENGAEYLRAGVIKAYSAGYANSVLSSPQLRVVGGGSKSGASVTAGTYNTTYYMVGTNYVENTSNGGGQNYSSDLVTWAACTGSAATSATLLRLAANGTSYLLAPSGAANTAPKYTSDGITFTAVGGTFTTFPAKTATAYGNSWWIALSSMNASTAGEMGYINNASPAGTWTVSAATDVTMTAVKAIAFGGSGNWFVAVGTSASATAGKLATCTTPATWTDRTVASGIAFAATESVSDVIFDGSVFVIYTSTNRIFTAIDPTGAWTQVDSPGDFSTSSCVGVAVTGSYSGMATDGAGTVALVYVGGAASAYRCIVYVTTDAGVSWKPLQPYPKAAASVASRISYANAKWLCNPIGAANGWCDLGDLITPDYIGKVRHEYQGQFVRIK